MRSRLLLAWTAWRYVAGGPSFYSLAEAMHDRYLDILMEEAEKSRESVRAEHQRWME